MKDRVNYYMSGIRHLMRIGAIAVVAGFVVVAVIEMGGGSGQGASLDDFWPWAGWVVGGWALSEFIYAATSEGGR